MSSRNLLPKDQKRNSFVPSENEEDEVAHDSDHSSNPRTLETNMSSAASSPRSAERDGQEMSSKQRHHHSNSNSEGGKSTSDQIEDPSRISWESGAVSVKTASRVTVKLLVSNNMAGSIIGRAGQTISDLQKQSSAKIRLSQSGDYFPGTSDRICLVHGTLDNVKEAIALVLGKLYELQLELVDTQLGHAEAANDDDSSLENNDTHAHENAAENPVKMNFSARILIPSAACGMLIGKEGATIKKLKVGAGASSVRLSPKVTDHSAPRTFERILTVSATDLAPCVSFSQSILEGFVRHPEICRYLNSTTSYSRSSSNVSYNSVPRASTTIAYSSPTSAPNPPRQQQPFAASHPSGHDVDAGMQALAFDTQPNVQSAQLQKTYINSTNAMSTSAIVPPTSQVSSFHASSGQVLQQRPNATNSSNHYGSTINLAVPDSIIGAILGRRGQTLRELQEESGARIKVSQRDEFVPGTTNRIVTISGPEESIETARTLIRALVSRNP